MDQLQIFRPKSTFLKLQYDKIKPNNFLVFPIFSSEVIFSSFPALVTCPIYNCEKFENHYHRNIWPKKNECQCCKDKKLVKKMMTYFICDIRIFKDDEEINYCGVLPGMKIFSRSKLMSNDFEKEVKKFIDDNSQEDRPLHVIFISNQTNKFELYENNLYSCNLSETEKFREKFGLSWKKETSLDKELVKRYLRAL